MALVIGGKDKEDTYKMKKRKAKFAVVTENKTVTQVGRSSIIQPRTYFRGGEVKWYQDKPRSKESDNNA